MLKNTNAIIINTAVTTMATAAVLPFQYKGNKGLDQQAFVEDIQNYVIVYKLTDAEACYLVRLSCAEKAKVWVRNIALSTNFKDLVELMVGRFQTTERKLHFMKELNKKSEIEKIEKILDYLDGLKLVAN